MDFNQLERAYTSAVIVAQGLKTLGHPKAEPAMKLKDMLGMALAKPDLLTSPAFAAVWATRAELGGLAGVGDLWDVVRQHGEQLRAMGA